MPAPPFSLSQLPQYAQSDPVTAALAAQAFAEILEEDDIAKLVTDAGFAPQQLLDGPLTEQGIALQRSQQGLPLTQFDSPLSSISPRAGRAISGGAADLLESFGLADIPVTFLDKLAGISDPGTPVGPEPPRPDELTNIPGIGNVDVPRTLTNIGLGFLPILGAGRKIAGLTKGVTNPLLRGSLTFGSTFGALETARQAGRRIGRGEPINPQEIVSESLIGAAAGIPVAATAFGRLKSAALPALTAAGTSAALPGVEFNPARVGSEALFGALFPLKFTDLQTTPSVLKPMDQLDVLRAGLEQSATAPTQRVRELVRTRLANMSDEQVTELLKRGGKEIEDTLFNQFFANPEGRLVTEFLRVRAANLIELSALPEEQLIRLAAEPGVQQQMAADALAFQRKSVRPLDADPLDLVANTPKEIVTAAMATQDREAARAIVQNEALSEIRQFTLARRLQKFKQGDRKLRQAVEGLEKESGLLKKTVEDFESETAKRLREIGPEVPAKFLRPSEAQIRPDFEGELRLMLFPENSARIRNLDNRLTDIRGRIRDIDVADPNPSLQSEKVRLQGVEKQLIDQRNEAVRALNDTIDVNVPPFFKTAEEAVEAATRLADGLLPNEITQLRRNLPAAFKKFESKVNNALQRLQTQRFRSSSALDRTLTNLVRKLKKERVLKDPFEGEGLTGKIGAQTLPALRDRVKALGGNLRRVGGRQFNYMLSLKGQSFRTKTIKEMAKVVDDLASGTIRNGLTLDHEASRRLMSAVHVGDGKFLVTDHVTGKAREVNSPGEAAEAVLREPPRDDQAPDLDIPGDSVLPGNAVAAKTFATQQAPSVGLISRPDFVPFAGKVTGPAFDKQIRTLAREEPLSNPTILQTVKNAFLDIESFIGDIPVFTGLMEPLIRQKNLRQQWLLPQLDKLRGIFRGIETERMSAIQDTFLARGNSREIIAQHHNLNGLERQAVRKLERFYGELFSINKDGVDELVGAFGKFRRVAGDPNRVVGDFAVPRTLAALEGAIKTGKVKPGGQNADEVAMSILHEAANERFGINQLIRDGEKMRGILRTRMRKAGENSKAGRQFAVAEDVLDRYLSIIGDRADIASAELSGAVGKVINPILKKLAKVPQKDTLTFKDLDRLSTMFTTWYSGMAMSYRLALATRNMFQSFLVAPKVGWSANMRGIKKAMSKEGRDIARDQGVFSQNAGLFLFDELETIREGLARSLQRIGLLPYRKADEWNRMVSFHSGRETVLEHGPKLLEGGTQDAFLLNTGLATDSVAIQRTVLRKLQNQGVEEAANFYGRHVAQDSQFIYSRENLPELLGGDFRVPKGRRKAIIGKVAGQFGTWPIGFYNYMRQNTSGFLRPNSIRGKSARRFLANYGILYGSMLGIGAFFGIDTSTWNFANPVSFEGGPGLQILRDVGNYVAHPSQFQKKIAGANLKRLATEFPFPMGAFLTDIRQSGDEQTEYRKLLTLLGFNVSEEPGIIEGGQ